MRRSDSDLAHQNTEKEKDMAWTIDEGKLSRRDKWDNRFLKVAEDTATWSKDPSTQTGAVIVNPDQTLVSVGFNGFARGMDDDPALYEDRDVKYERIIHCEMNGCITAARNGVSVVGCTLYTWPFFSCPRCAVHMVQFGIERFVAPMCPDHLKDRWGEALDRAIAYAKEAGKEVRIV